MRNVTDIKLWGIWFLFILLAIGMNWLTYSCFKEMFRLRQELGKSKGGRH
ncbi:nicotinate-nucleotide pyrophosphorylase [Streptococcus pneumoniae GA60132]|nr:nicotinate-nucleotide pyrophosphorylase [Streptococcus pneumoniae GA60132]